MVELVGIGEATGTDLLGSSLLSRFVMPFEVVSFLLLAALIGGITLARKDTSPAEQEAAGGSARRWLNPPRTSAIRR